MDGVHGLRAWRWLFIIEGSITVGIAFSAYFILPNLPRTTSWLTEEERQLAAWRLEEDVGEDDWVDSEHQSFWIGLKLAFTDIKLYILVSPSVSPPPPPTTLPPPIHMLTREQMIMLFGVVASGSVTNFFPTVVQTLGFSSTISLLLTAPPYVLCVFTSLFNAWHADRTGERYWHMVLPLIVTMAAFILAATTTSLAPRYVAMMLMVPGIYTAYVIVLAWISNTLARPPAKRAASLAACNAVSNLSSVYASYMYPPSAGPRYEVAMSVNCATAAVAMLMATLLRWLLVRENRRLDAGEAADGTPTVVANKAFRYRV